MGSVGWSQPPTTHHRSDGPSRRPASQPGRARMTRDVDGPDQSTTSFKPSSVTCVSPVRAYLPVGLQRLASPPRAPGPNRSEGRCECRFNSDGRATNRRLPHGPFLGQPTAPCRAVGDGRGGGSKRKHPIEPTCSHGFDLRSHRGTIRCLASSVAPRCRGLPAFGMSSMCEKGFHGGGRELASAFRLRSSVRKRSRWPSPALTWKHPRIPSTRSMAPPNVNVKRLGPAILPLLFPPPGHRPWFQRVAYKVIPTTASRLPPTTNIPK